MSYVYHIRHVAEPENQTNCLISFFPEEALAEAARLDAIFKETGKVVGPLHGLPVSIKV
jgi:amidase